MLSLSSSALWLALVASSAQAFQAPSCGRAFLRYPRVGNSQSKAASWAVGTTGIRRAKLRPILNMQWNSEELYQEKWDAFAAYNLGRWKGRALHISPETGEYVRPFAKNQTVDIKQMVEGALVSHPSDPCPTSARSIMRFSLMNCTPIVILTTYARYDPLQSAKMRVMGGNETAPSLVESVITINDDFDSASDG
jgi:hypothetical protein